MRRVLWSFPLGPRSQGSPSVSDIDGDGKVEIVLNSYDGNVWVLGEWQASLPAGIDALAHAIIALLVWGDERR